MCSNDDEVMIVAELANAYLSALHQKDISSLKKLFHDEAFLFGFVNDQFEHISINQWLAKINEIPIEEFNKPYKNSILSVNVVKNLAAVTLAHDFLGLHFYNCLSLVKSASGWLIVNKSFRGRVKEH